MRGELLMMRIVATISPGCTFAGRNHFSIIFCILTLAFIIRIKMTLAQCRATPNSRNPPKCGCDQNECGIYDSCGTCAEDYLGNNVCGGNKRNTQSCECDGCQKVPRKVCNPPPSDGGDGNDWDWGDGSDGSDGNDGGGHTPCRRGLINGKSDLSKRFRRVCRRWIENEIVLSLDSTTGPTQEVKVEDGGLGFEGEGDHDVTARDLPLPFQDFSLDGDHVDIISSRKSLLNAISSSNSQTSMSRNRRCANGHHIVYDTICTTSCECDECTADSCDFEAWCCPGYKPFRGDKTMCVPSCDLIRDPCSRNGICVEDETKKGYFCNCSQGFSGDRCEKVSVDHCASTPCLNDGICLSTARQYYCVCGKNYSGTNCEEIKTTVKTCENSNPCRNGGNCTQIYVGASLKCKCPRAFKGKYCQEDENECTVNPGICGNHGTCLNLRGSFECICQTGYTGKTCNVKIDHCKTPVIRNCGNGTCVSLKNGFYCACPYGHVGYECRKRQGRCERQNLCLHPAAKCINVGDDDFKCIDCPSRFGGKRCDIVYQNSINTCDPSPCARGGKCKLDSQGGFKCSCLPGWGGLLCDERDTSLCLSLPCRYGTCIVTDDTKTFISSAKCVCDAGYEGSACDRIVDPCKKIVCKNAALTPCQPIGGDDYFCTCDRSLFLGKNCDIPINSTETDCDKKPCKNGGKCIVTNDGRNFRCECTSGYDGRLCNQRILECASGPCQQGECSDEPEGYVCKCYEGYTGPRCEDMILLSHEMNTTSQSGTHISNSTNASSYAERSCIHGVVVYDIHNHPICRCIRLGEFQASGINCDVLQPICKKKYCLNCGTCKVLNGSAACTCPPMVNGSRCEIIPKNYKKINDCSLKSKIENAEESASSQSEHSSKTTLIVVVASLLMGLLVGTFIYHRRKKKKSVNAEIICNDTYSPDNMKAINKLVADGRHELMILRRSKSATYDSATAIASGMTVTKGAMDIYDMEEKSQYDNPAYVSAAAASLINSDIYYSPCSSANEAYGLSSSNEAYGLSSSNEAYNLSVSNET